METRAAIIGLGLMGASLGAALRKAGGWNIVGMDRSDERASIALQHGFVDHVEPTLEQAVSGADLIVFATPIGTILNLIEDLAKIESASGTVMDLGSTKKSITERMSQLPDRFSSIGGHPMTGKFTSNTEDADADLYAQRKFVLVETKKTNERAKQLADKVLADIRAIPVHMEADAHDYAVSLISHLPHFMSVPLVSTTNDAELPILQDLAAGGFRRAASGASDNLPMWIDIAFDNADNIADALLKYADHAKTLAALVQRKDYSALSETLSKASEDYDAFVG